MIQKKLEHLIIQNGSTVSNMNTNQLGSIAFAHGRLSLDRPANTIPTLPSELAINHELKFLEKFKKLAIYVLPPLVNKYTSNSCLKSNFLNFA
jgi:hypothetical protein